MAENPLNKMATEYLVQMNGAQKSLKLPIGIENFEKLRTEGFYYVDKTGLIKELLNNSMAI